MWLYKQTTGYLLSERQLTETVCFCVISILPYSVSKCAQDEFNLAWGEKINFILKKCFSIYNVPLASQLSQPTLNVAYKLCQQR